MMIYDGICPFTMLETRYFMAFAKFPDKKDRWQCLHLCRINQCSKPMNKPCPIEVLYWVYCTYTSTWDDLSYDRPRILIRSFKKGLLFLQTMEIAGEKKTNSFLAHGFLLEILRFLMDKSTFCNKYIVQHIQDPVWGHKLKRERCVLHPSSFLRSVIGFTLQRSCLEIVCKSDIHIYIIYIVYFYIYICIYCGSHGKQVPSIFSLFFVLYLYKFAGG